MEMINQIVDTPNRKEIDLKRLQETDHPIYIYGAGSYAEDVTKFLEIHGVGVAGYAVDKKYVKKDKKFLGKNVQAIEDVCRNNENANIVIGFNDHIKARESLSQLRENDSVFFFDAPHQLTFFNKSYIKERQQEFQRTYDWLEDDESKAVFIAFINSKISGDPTPLYKLTDFNQYFSDPVILSDKEVFVDCGAYDGDTIRNLLKNTEMKYQKIYAFEPDTNNYKKLHKYLKENDIKNVTTVNKGTWSAATELNFSSDGNMASIVEDDGDFTIQVETIDSIIGDDKATYIKMDIEGAELEALKGAERVIKRSNPKLAICAYHKPEDLITLPQYIRSINKNYKFYLRQHQLISWEMVLYALPG